MGVDIGVPHPLVEALIDSAGKLGIPRNDDFNGPVQEGVGYLPAHHAQRLRCSTATAYLRPARRRANLDVRTHAHATRIVFDGRRATGVALSPQAARHPGRRPTRSDPCAPARCNRLQLLQLSGVGHPRC
jgi:choline dehydrogenase